MTIVALWLEYDGRLVVEQRPDEGLLANMWQLPSFEWSTTSADDDEGIHLAARKRLESLVVGYTSSVEDAAQAMVRERTAPRDFVTLTTAKHVFTHLEWDVVVVRPIGYHQIEGLQLQANQRLVPLHELSSLAWPKVYITILREVAGQDVRLVES